MDYSLVDHWTGDQRVVASLRISADGVKCCVLEQVTFLLPSSGSIQEDRKSFGITEKLLTGM